ncbi:MAG: NUDIX domain-containing protein, partial [Bacteroidetes bacterium]|nr:NUDIX domain-containing protein [Bacteroidota bacterium]
MQVEYVVLVNQEDRPLGTLEKMEAHERGVLHRAFSVFVFNKSGELMLQKRAEDKYHSPGLWTNTVCSHPRLNEAVMQAAHRRLLEEMGFDCELKKVFSFIY